ncbi:MULTISPECIES: DnaJ domain-containing protein [Halomonadaceae]|uniref:DnaJ-like protein n=1 Tax=Onishia taeanensis TaxID=284577 RepID=A0A328XSD7_9GAMM|nr:MULTISPECIES: J domain-containing protein [Halomonas]RAR62912.1 DnaJ-like protein [Halomonas taeanensis]
MPSGRFNPFETLLLTSRSQADTAGLLLLAWVMACRGPLNEAQRRHLTELASECRHGHDLEPIFALADRQDFDAIQLAAEVMQKDRGGEQAYPFLRQAIAVSVVDGEPSISQHHVLRFLADLLGVIPSLFATLYAEQAGRPYAVPEDPSRRDYWLAKEHQRQQEEARQHEQDERRREQEARERQEQELRRQRERREQEARERERQRQENARQERAHRERAQQERARQDQAREERARQERQRQEKARQERSNAGQNQRWQQAPPNDARAHRALAVLGLPPGASRGEIRKAYRRMAQTHHPDRFFAEGEARMATASQRFQRIKNAYEYLMRAS